MSKNLTQTIGALVGINLLIVLFLFIGSCQKEVEPFSTEPLIGKNEVKKMPKELPSTVILNGKKYSKEEYEVRKTIVALKYKNYDTTMNEAPITFADQIEAIGMVKVKKSLCGGKLTVTDDEVKNLLISGKGDGNLYFKHILNKEEC